MEEENIYTSNNASFQYFYTGIFNPFGIYFRDDMKLDSNFIFSKVTINYLVFLIE